MRSTIPLIGPSLNSATPRLSPASRAAPRSESPSNPVPRAPRPGRSPAHAAAPAASASAGPFGTLRAPPRSPDARDPPPPSARPGRDALRSSAPPSRRLRFPGSQSPCARPLCPLPYCVSSGNKLVSPSLSSPQKSKGRHFCRPVMLRRSVLQLRKQLHAEVIPQHAAPVQHVHRELLSQRVGLITHHHAQAEIAHLRVLGDRARTRQRLRQPAHNQTHRILRERQIVRGRRRAAGLRNELRAENEEVLH